jgi:hypothetical protein
MSLPAKQWSSDTTKFGIPVLNPDGSSIASPNSSTSTSPTLTSVSVSAASTTLLASNSARKSVFIDNNATAIAYVRLSASAATTAIGGYNYAIQPSGTLSLPDVGAPIYTGQINIIWAAATGSGASVTEY